MKKIFLYFSFPLFMMLATSNIYAAASCKRDLDEMNFKIQAKGSLRTTNGIIIHVVHAPVMTHDDESCAAHASGNHLNYAIFWKAGSWEHTLFACPR
ncbi:hypothetical protein [Candidatus Sororendozoicomonas aggregata]|uniref:hypothetical protein n=1 Tax=Candidatus Sororendozoicomonas aggregata TaxID=3073239 RepID=UPI002ED31249